MKILVTGASGFLGAEMVKTLQKDYQIITFGSKNENNISCDIRNTIPELPKVDIVVHAAGKAHSIPKNEIEAEEFHKVNAEGTKNLIDALAIHLPQTFVLISTVAVYGKDEGVNITEEFPLEGQTPYAKSKILAEQHALNWGEKMGVSVVILRLPLVSGKNPPGNLKSMAQAITKGFYLSIGNADARKSLVSANDVAQLIPELKGKSGIYNLTDGFHPEVREIENYIAGLLGKKIKKVSLWPLKWAANIGDVITFLPINSLRLRKLTSSLTFNDTKARQELGWAPKPALNALRFDNY